jgi:hypothetical protein
MSREHMRLYIWFGMLIALLTYLLLALTAISQIEPREMVGGLAVLRNILLGLSAFSLLIGFLIPPVVARVSAKFSANPYFNFSSQLFFYNAAAVFGLIIGVIAGRLPYVLWPTAIAFLGMALIYPRKRAPQFEKAVQSS